jgi:hypothetical protein
MLLGVFSFSRFFFVRRKKVLTSLLRGRRFVFFACGQDHGTCRYSTGRKIRVLVKRKTAECQIDTPPAYFHHCLHVRLAPISKHDVQFGSARMHVNIRTTLAMPTFSCKRNQGSTSKKQMQGSRATAIALLQPPSKHP